MRNYLVALRTGQNDLAALENLSKEDQEKIVPLISIRGNKEKPLNKLLENWDGDILLDVSRQPRDIKQSALIKDNELLNEKNAFHSKREYFEKLKKIKNFVPVVSWLDSHSQREIVRYCFELHNSGFDKIAIRLDAKDPNDHDISVINSIINAFPSPEKLIIIFDYQKIEKPLSTDAKEWLSLTIQDLTFNYGIEEIYLLSTSFPTEKPARNTPQYYSNSDLIWQLEIINIYSQVHHGDYATSDPTGEMEFIPGMTVYPYAAYSNPRGAEWWTIRQGEDKEFSQYVDIATQIVALPFFGSVACWGDENYSRISQLDPTDDDRKGWGNSGQWVGYRINQHIVYTLDFIETPTEEEEDLD